MPQTPQVPALAGMSPLGFKQSVKEVPLNVVNLEEFTRIQNALIEAQADLRKAHIKRGKLCGKAAFASKLADQREFDRLRAIRDEADALRFRTVLDTEEGITWGRPAPKKEA